MTTGTATAALTDTRTVDRVLAHRPSVEQVWVTDVVDDGELLLAMGHLPRLHRFHNDTPTPHHDALTLAEFTRQALEVLSHALLDVPMDSRFVLRRLELEVLDREATRIGPAEAGVVVALPAKQVRRNRRGAIAAAGPVRMTIGGLEAARFGGTVAFMASRAYDGMRRPDARIGLPEGLVAAVAPAAVGREVASNVLIGRVEGPPRTAAAEVVPTAHPVFFDRPTDHYPGMMITEAARQLAVHALATEAGVPAGSVDLDRVAADFTAFAELDAPLRLRVTRWADRPEGAEVTVQAYQGDVVATACSFRLST